MFTTEELDNLANIEVDESLLEQNLCSRSFDAASSRRMTREMCDEFVKAFLENDAVPLLHQELKECDDSLANIEHILEKFFVNLETTQKEIGDVQDRLKCIGISLTNAKDAERFVRGVMSRLIIPPEVLHIIVECNDEELGPQFMLSVRKLLELLRHRTEIGSRVEVSAIQAQIRSCKMYAEQLEVLNRLTVHACVKIKKFLSKKLTNLTIKNTNVYIQQEHVLKPYAFYVHFLQSAVILLRFPSENNQIDFDSQPALPFSIVRALYNELRREYCDMMSQFYFNRVRHYVMTLNSMESSTQTIQFGDSQVVYVLPLLTEAQEATPLSTFELGQRAAILSNVMSPPLVPVVELAKRRQHFYEETFRSLNVLFCDAVTHEFVFIFLFFGGDMSVFREVFRPTEQFIVDYLAEVMLGQSNGCAQRIITGEFSKASVNPNCRYDCFGLLLLIRMCYDFRFLMNDSRRLGCLENLYDSLLLLLWPMFQRSFERQMLALRSANVVELSRVVLNRRCDGVNNNDSGCGNGNCGDSCGGRQAFEWVRFVHPLAKMYAAFTISIARISPNCVMERRSNEQTGLSSCFLTFGGSENVAVSLNISDEIDLAELQRIAKGVIEAERASDAAAGLSRFVALREQLSFMRIEILRLLQEVGRYIASTDDTTQPEMREAKFTAFLLNNVRHILTAWENFFDDTAVTQLGEDYRALEEFEQTHRTKLVEGLVRLYFPLSHHVLRKGESVVENDPEKLLLTADVFRKNWKIYLEALCDAVRKMFADSTYEAEVLAQVCIEVLQYNSHFHVRVSQALEELSSTSHSQSLSSVATMGSVSHKMRSFVVSDQQLLQHMRTLATIQKEEKEEVMGVDVNGIEEDW